MFKNKCCYSLGESEIKNTVDTIYIRCSNCGKETMIDVDILDTTYQDKIIMFLLNTMLQHIVMLWIFEPHEELQYDMYKHDSEWMTGCPW